MQQRIELWKRIYDTDDNAITKALSKMAWDLAVFTCVVEIVRQAPDARNGKKLNGMLLDMLASGFWSSTMQGVRRLAEMEAINGPRGVCSLGGLIQDARAARGRLTREIFVKDIAGLDYNYEATRSRYWDFMQANAGGGAVWVPREFHYEASEQRHTEFDWLSGTTPSTSNPDDLIREEVFDALERRLAQLEGVVEHVNVEIAHAATEASRQGRVLDRFGLDDAKAAMKELAQIAELAGHWFCFSGIGTVLPTPQFDQFEHLDQPLFAGNTNDLQAIWDTLDEEISQWHTIDARAL
jgi:hypothetical protein